MYVFGHLSSDESSFTEVTRRLSIIGSHSDDVLTRFKGCRLHSILVFDRKFAEAACSANFKLLKVLDFEFAQDISHLPQCIGNLFHLKYLSVARTSVAVLPRSIGKLENLETLNLKGSGVREIPVEINELHRLQNLLASSPYGVRIPEGFGCLTSLQTLDCIALDDDDEVCREQMAELSKLIQLRKLGISNCPQTRDGTGLCEYIKEMKHLESLHVLARQRGLDIDIGYSSAVSPPESIRSLVLVGKLKKLPEWIIKLQNLAKLVIRQSALEDDPLGVFHNLHSLVTLKLYDGAYTGEEFYFERGLFPRLRCLHVENLRSLYNLEIEEGALPALEELRLVGMDSLRDVPWGVQHLRNLKMLQVDITRDREKILIGRYYDFMDISPGGSCYHIVQHIPNVWDFRSVSDV